FIATRYVWFLGERQIRKRGGGILLWQPNPTKHPARRSPARTVTMNNEYSSPTTSSPKGSWASIRPTYPPRHPLNIGALTLPADGPGKPPAAPGIGKGGPATREKLGTLIGMRHVCAGKVRDLYSIDGDLLLVASDRISAYDVVLPTPIPDKGALLTQLSVWWFHKLETVAPNHLVSATDVPAEFGNRAIRCAPLRMVPVECIARGYLTGLGLREYQKTGSVS